jgi:uncharacterized membrane protein
VVEPWFWAGNYLNMSEFTVQHDYPVSREVLWEIFSDFGRSSNPSAEIHMETEGDRDNHRIGAVRRIVIHGQSYREKLTAFVPGQSITYELLDGAPVENYTGTIAISGADQRSTVHWRVKYKPRFPVPGWMIEKNARKVISGILAELHDVLTRG